jgi:GntR family transcriptional regulator
MTSDGFTTGAARLDRAGGEPLWAQLESELRRRLDLGHFIERFPTDRELMNAYGVSRHTARQAVGRLGADGIVRRARGVGTSVDAARFEQSLGSLYSLFQVVEASGLEQNSEVLALETTIDVEAAERLGLAPDAELVLLARLRLAGGEPLAVDRAWMPASVASGLLDADFSHTSLYDELERVAGCRPGSGSERIIPLIPAESERRLLGLDDGEAAFCIDRLGCHEGRPVEWRRTILRGDRFSFVADWTAGRMSELRPEHRLDT